MNSHRVVWIPPRQQFDDAKHMMEKQGGNFVKALVACYYAADDLNRCKLHAAFEKYFTHYEDMFREHCAQAATKADV